MEEIHYLIGQDCNLSCDFCFWNKKYSDPSLKFKKKIVDQIVSSGIKKVTLSGGEPMMSSQIIEVLSYMKKKGLETILHTNGLLIDETNAFQIAKKVSRVSLSMDGYDEDSTHKMRKTSGMYEHTKDLINYFSLYSGTPVNVKTLVTKVNCNDVLKIGNSLKEHKIEYWSLLRYQPINDCNEMQSRYYISKDKFEDVVSQVRKNNFDFKIKRRDYSSNKNKYLFIAANGDLYTNLGRFEDIRLGNLANMCLQQAVAGFNHKLQN